MHSVLQVLFALPTSFAQGLVVLFALIIDMPRPLNTIQILWVNLLVSTTVGIALGFEKPEPDVMDRPPRKPGKRLLSSYVLFRSIYVTVLNVIVTLGNFQWERDIGGSLAEASTVAMNTIVAVQTLYLLNCRFLSRSSLRPSVLYKGNKFVLLAIAIVGALQGLVSYTPGIQDVWDTAAINGLAWLRILGLAVAVFLVVEVEKFLKPRVTEPYILPVVRWLRRRIPAFTFPLPLPWHTSSASVLGYPTPLTPTAAPPTRAEMDEMARVRRASTRRLIVHPYSQEGLEPGNGTGVGPAAAPLASVASGDAHHEIVPSAPSAGADAPHAVPISVPQGATVSTRRLPAVTGVVAGLPAPQDTRQPLGLAVRRGGTTPSGSMEDGTEGSK